MKTTIATCLVLSIAAGAFVSDEPLVPDRINQILGRIEPGMSHAKFQNVLKTYYPEAKIDKITWSGQTGVVGFKLTSRYSIAVTEYIDPKDGKSHVHNDLVIYVYDWKLKRRIDISFYKWDDKTKKVSGKTSRQDSATDAD